MGGRSSATGKNKVSGSDRFCDFCDWDGKTSLTTPRLLQTGGGGCGRRVFYPKKYTPSFNVFQMTPRVFSSSIIMSRSRLISPTCTHRFCCCGLHAWSIVLISETLHPPTQNIDYTQEGPKPHVFRQANYTRIDLPSSVGGGILSRLPPVQVKKCVLRYLSLELRSFFYQ